MIKRFYDIDKILRKGKVLVIYGARRTGKTTLLNEYLNNSNLKYKLDSGDNITVQQILSSQKFNDILSYVENYDLYVIDEAQQVPNIGMGLKILIDNKPELLVISTGSSSFELAQNIGEPLTGRKRTYALFPFAQKELLNIHNKFELKQKLEDYLIFGSYPEVITSKSDDEKIEVISEIVNSYLLKDILSLERIRSSSKLLDLLKLLAFQVGSEVSHNELATQLKLDVKTVSRYIDLLEKTFVIQRLDSYSRNLRNEIKNKSKYYFIDNGIRNGVIAQFNKLNLRNDVGALFENFIVVERMKLNSYNRTPVNYYFWRNYVQKEIDFIEEREGKLFAYEIKWSDKKKYKLPSEWKKEYTNSEFKLINSENYLEFIID